MVKVAVVYHSGYGHTEKVAQAVVHGARDAGAQVDLLAIAADGGLSEADWAVLDAADAIIFGSPTYMGNVSGSFKMFADASSKRWFTQAWKDKLAGGFTNSMSLSGEKLASLQTMSILAAQHSMLWVSHGQMPAMPGEQKHQRPEDAVNRIGSALGVMTQAENEPAEVTPPSGDLRSATLYGERVAQAAQRWVKGA